MKIQKLIIIFFISLFCISCKVKNHQIPAEDVFTRLGKTYDVCGRCGNIAVNLGNAEGDILLINWDSPYVDYQNKSERITLKHKTVYKDGKTYVDPELFFILGYKVE